MTVRLKMPAISAIILVLFAIVLVGSVVMQKLSGDKVAVAALADDGAAGVLRDRSTAFLTPPPPVWDGSWRLTEK